MLSQNLKRAMLVGLSNVAALILILAALEADELYAASLDVFQAEPLPHSSPLWSHPRVVVTPHNAAESAPEAIVRYALRQMSAARRREPLENVVDPTRGY